MSINIPTGETTRMIEEPAKDASRDFRAELAMALGGFGIGTGEFAIMGILPEIAGDTHSTVTESAYAISSYALGVVIGAPLIAVMAARWRRDALLVALMIWFAIGYVVSALAPSLPWLVAARFFAGLPHGAYFGVASLVAASLVPPDRRAQAVGRMMLGLTGATLAGVPLATWMGQQLGWRASFGLVAAIGFSAAAAIRLCVPRQPVEGEASAFKELSALRNRQVLLALAVGSVGMGGLFSIFSYITPLMTKVAGLPEGWMPMVLAVFGVGMISGNLIGSKLADRALLATVAGTLIWSVVVMGLFPIWAHDSRLAVLGVFLIAQGAALGPALQVRLMDVAGEAQTLAASLHHSAFNIANALGAWLGGVAIDAGLGWTSTGWVGSLLAMAGFAIFLVSIRGEWLARAFASPGIGRRKDLEIPWSAWALMKYAYR